NYYVLRHNVNTAVLGEASYISNPAIEKKLKDDDKIELEAKSYLLGILDYFSRGIPRITDILPSENTTVQNALPVFKAALEEDLYGDGINPESIVIAVDDHEIPFIYEDLQITASPEQPLTNGPHTLFVNVANLKGNHSVLKTSHFIVDMEPQEIIVRHTPSVIPPGIETPMMINAEIVDRYFNAVRDSTPVHLSIDENPDYDKTVYTRNGQVNFYYYFGSPDIHHYTITVGSIFTQGTIEIRNTGEPLFAARVRDALNQIEYLENARLGLDNDEFRYTNADGYAYFESISSGEYSLSAHKAGYYPVRDIQNIDDWEPVFKEILLEPMYNRALFGRKIFIDPEFGGIDPGSIGPTGLRAADENVETAQYLAHFLKTAGADVMLTRGKGEDMTPYSRVRLANREGAELFVSLRHEISAGPNVSGITTYAYPTSSTGKRVASLILDSFKSHMNTGGTGPIEAADYVLQQTGCPAVVVNLGYISHPETEELLYGTRYNRDQAYSIFIALIQFYAGDSIRFGTLSGEVKDGNGSPVNNALVTLDNTISLQTGKDGRFIFNLLESGEYQVEVRAKGFSVLSSDTVINPGESVVQEFRLVH
ncbi:N-acetylmuramoyl-L-alanine amidase, partial [candidate division KSB1 bacterium]